MRYDAKSSGTESEARAVSQDERAGSNSWSTSCTLQRVPRLSQLPSSMLILGAELLPHLSLWSLQPTRWRLDSGP